MWAAALAALKQPNRVGADPGAFRQFFLRQLRAVAKAPQQFGKGCRASIQDVVLCSLLLPDSIESS